MFKNSRLALALMNLPFLQNAENKNKNKNSTRLKGTQEEKETLRMKAIMKSIKIY